MVDETVAIVEWPAEADRLDALRALGTPRLIVVAPQEPTPSFVQPLDPDEIEDWVRAPISYDDVTARYARLASHAVALTHVRDGAVH